MTNCNPFIETNWEAFAHDVTKNWLKEHISKSNVVLFSHHPLVAEEMLEVDYSFDDDTLGDMETFIGSDGWKNVLANFAGHIHGFWGYDWPVLNPKVFMNANVDYSKEKPTVYIKHDDRSMKKYVRHFSKTGKLLFVYGKPGMRSILASFSLLALSTLVQNFMFQYASSIIATVNTC